MFALLSAFLPAASHALAKILTENYHPVVVVFFRCVVSLMGIGVWAALTQNFSFYQTDHLKSNIIRGVLGTLSVITVVFAYATLPVGDIAALLNVAPLMSVILAFFFLREKISKGRAFILLAGFMGVMLMVQPSGQIPLHGVMIGLLAAFGIAVTTVLIRHLGKTESPLTITFYFSVVGTVLCGCVIPFFWTGWVWHSVGVIVAMGVFGLLAQLSHAEALRRLPIAIKEPIGYTFFLWSLFLGYAIWDSIPTTIVLCGAAIVIASNILLVLVEYRKSKTIKNEQEMSVFS